MTDERFVLLEPHAVLVAKSAPIPGVIAGLYEALGGEYRERHDKTDSPAATMEFAGRTCYQAYSCASEKTDSHEGYLHNILHQRHESVLEHSSYTFFLSGISRADSHEIVRHRHLSFSQLSQRFVLNETPYEISLHPTIAETVNGQGSLEPYIEQLVGSFDAARYEYEFLSESGYSRKQAAEAARTLLPNAASVSMVVTGNVRSWMEFISKRDHEAADRSLQVIAGHIYEILKNELPEVFSEEARAIWDESASQAAMKESK